jgi:arabinogalactan endo-1,4-beta-galactosidase
MRWSSRATVIALAICLAGCGLYGPGTNVGIPSSSAAPVIRGADISTALLEESAGKTLSAGGKTLPIEQVLANAGANYVRLRLWVGGPPGYGDEQTALRLARRAAAVGMKIYLDFHYSDTWADLESQNIPPSWRDLDLDELSARVYDYTKKVVSDFARQGTPADITQIGNEISSGFLRPLGDLNASRPQGGWPDFLTLLRAGVAGAKAGNPPGHRLLIALHYARVAADARTHDFFDQVSKAGIAFDIIALTYYPFWNGKLSSLLHAMDDLSRRYGRGVLVAETAYPWTLSGDRKHLVVNRWRQLPETNKYPPSKSGQAAYFAALRDLIVKVPNSGGLGFLDFEPGWLPGVGTLPSDSADPFANQTMFDRAGKALPALGVAFAPTGRARADTAVK